MKCLRIDLRINQYCYERKHKTLLNKLTHRKFLNVETLIETNQFSQIDL